MQRFRGGLVFKAHRLVYHSTLGSRVTKKKRRSCTPAMHSELEKSAPPWRQPRGKSMVSSVNSHTNVTRIGWHLWEIDLRFAPGLPPGWDPAAYPERTCTGGNTEKRGNADGHAPSRSRISLSLALSPLSLSPLSPLSPLSLLSLSLLSLLSFLSLLSLLSLSSLARFRPSFLDLNGIA